MTYKEHCALLEKFEAEDAGRKIAAEMLNTSTSKLKLVNKDLEEKVLDTGKELKHKFMKMAISSLVVRLFSAFGKLFARVEVPSGSLMTFEVAGG